MPESYTPEDGRPIIIQISGPPQTEPSPATGSASTEGFGNPNAEVSKEAIREMEKAHNQWAVRMHPQNQPGPQTLGGYARDHMPHGKDGKLLGAVVIGVSLLATIGLIRGCGGDSGSDKGDPLRERYGAIMADAAPGGQATPPERRDRSTDDAGDNNAGFFAESGTCIARGSRTLGRLARPDTLDEAVMLIDRMDQPGVKAACYQLGSDATRQLMGLPKGTTRFMPHWPVQIPQSLEIK